MASKVATTAKEAATKARPNFQVGKKKVFLPSAVVRLLPPRRVFSPYYAAFQVPLTFTKLDLRDYLFHAYGVEVRGVRSWVTNRRPRQRSSEPGGAQRQDGIYDNTVETNVHDSDPSSPWYRPQAIKRMMVELVRPFAYPQPPPVRAAGASAKDNAGGEGDDAAADAEEEDPRAPWESDVQRRMAAQQRLSEQMQRKRLAERLVVLHDEEEHVAGYRVALAQEARTLVRGERAWQSNQRMGAAAPRGGAGVHHRSGGAAGTTPAPPTK